MGNVKHVHFTNTGTAGQTDCFNQISRHLCLVLLQYPWVIAKNVAASHGSRRQHRLSSSQIDFTPTTSSSQSETVLRKLYSFLILLDLTRTRTRVRRQVKRGAHQERLRYQLDHWNCRWKMMKKTCTDETYT